MKMIQKKMINDEQLDYEGECFFSIKLLLLSQKWLDLEGAPKGFSLL